MTATRVALTRTADPLASYFSGDSFVNLFVRDGLR